MTLAARYAPPAVPPATPATHDRSDGLSIGAIYREARASYGAASGTFVFATLLFFGVGYAVQRALDAALAALTTDPTLRALLGVIASTFVGAFASAGFGLFVLDGARGTPLRLRRLAEGLPYLWPMFVVSVLTTLGTLALGLALVVPGVIFHVATSQATWLVLDRGLDPWSALRGSIRITRGHRGWVFGLFLAESLVMLAGVLALGVGVLVAWPLSQLMAAHAYRRLAGEGEGTRG